MISVIIVAGGKGKRMGQDVNKQYIKLEDKEVLAITINAFHKVDSVDEIIVVTCEDEIEFCNENIIKRYNFNKVKKLVAGGLERQMSVYNGLLSCNHETEVVLIHDGARPFVTEKMIMDSIEGARNFGACTVAIPVKDTIKIVDEANTIINTLKRNELFSIQTPQAFRFDLILKGHREAIKNKVFVTDDTALIEAMGKEVKIVMGSYFNIKLTTIEDLVFARAILSYDKDNAKAEESRL
jgi:2-C-methyl-D-erythritol 4-phosphate cytidylyltransferase